jgi:hypothetical protein
MRIPFCILLLIGIACLAIHYSLDDRRAIQNRVIAETLLKLDFDFVPTNVRHPYHHR